MTDLDQKAWAEAVRHVHDGNPLWIALADNALSTEGARALIAAYLAALPPSPAIVPEGCKLVPVEPTEAMTKAGFGPFLAAHDPFFNKNEPTAPIYRAMLAAAPPSPPALDGAGRDGIDKAIALLRPAGNIAYNMAAGAQSQNKDGAAYEFGRIRDAIDAAIRALKETP